MSELVDECISFIVYNMHDVVRLPIEMSCLSDSILSILAENCPISRLWSL